MFVLEQDGLRSYLVYRISGSAIEFTDAFVPPVHRGRGYASALILYGIHFAVMNGLLIKASCPAAAEYLRRNPEWHYTLAIAEAV